MLNFIAYSGIHSAALSTELSLQLSTLSGCEKQCRMAVQALPCTALHCLYRTLRVSCIHRRLVPHFLRSVIAIQSIISSMNWCNPAHCCSLKFNTVRVFHGFGSLQERVIHAYP